MQQQQVYIVSSQNNNSQAYSIGQSSSTISNNNNGYGYSTSTSSTTIYPQNIQVQVRTQNGTGGGNYIIQDQRGHWRDGLCDCFSNIFPSCAMSFFFQCVILGQISENLNFAPCGFICCGYVGIWILFLILTLYIFGLQWIIWVCIALLIWGLRNQLRTTQRIPGNSLEDCFVSFFCQGCAIAQMARHLFQYREVCDEISCSNDGRPSYFNQLNQNQNQITGTSGYIQNWQQSQHQPQQIYVHPQQPQYATSYTPQYIQPQVIPISVSTSGHGSTISKPGWQDNVGGAATPYNQQNSGIINPSSITITTAAPAPQYPTIVVAQPVPQLTHTPIRYQEEDAPVQFQQFR